MKQSILVVEDNQDIGTLLLHLFSREYEVLRAARGLQGLSLFKKRRPHLVLLDINLPDMSGTDVLRSILDCDKQAVVLMISGNLHLEQARDAMSIGAAGYVCKPFNCGELKDLVRAALRRQPAPG